MEPKYSIIIPTRNEEEAIAKVICSIPEEIEKESEIIVVDSSNDYTPVIAERLGAKVIKIGRKGKGRAMKRGVKESKGKVLIFLDGDGTDPPQYIPKLLKKLKKANLVLGCRSPENFKGGERNIRILFKFYAFFVGLVFAVIGFNVLDPLAGFRAIRKEDWYALDLKSNEFEIEAEMNVKCINKGFKISVVPIPCLKRGGGLLKSKLVTNPKQWLPILNIVIKHIRDEKVRKKLEELKSGLETKKKMVASYFKI
ncbi:MAG: glycosyltransferase family 2 protein [Candidatus Aenigmarchaeota archaeon]|nr:glycosyltransferase family 2 protein [Candidatus Aenigmarchaeota archaeon]